MRKARKWRRRQKTGEGVYILSRDRRREIGEQTAQARGARAKRRAEQRQLRQEYDAAIERAYLARVAREQARAAQLEANTRFYEKQVNPKTMPKWLR